MQTLTKLGTWVEVLGEMEGGGFEKDKMQKFTGDFLIMINVLKPVYLKVS
jgi:hypothetical protein